jgi:hypothetical protein
VSRPALERSGADAPAVAGGRPAAHRAWCLLPGLCGFVGYALYPALTRSQAALDPVERLGAPLYVENADVMALIAGIVTSAICCFYAERAAPDATSRRSG